jgi:hypothetical protein
MKTISAEDIIQFLRETQKPNQRWEAWEVLDDLPEVALIDPNGEIEEVLKSEQENWHLLKWCADAADQHGLCDEIIIERAYQRLWDMSPKWSFYRLFNRR